MKIKKLLFVSLLTVTLAACNMTPSTTAPSYDSTSTTTSSIISPTSSVQTPSTSVNNPSVPVNSSSQHGSSINPTTPIVKPTTPIVTNDYYNGFDFSKTGDAMKTYIMQWMKNTHKLYTSYDSLKRYIPIVDAVPDKSNEIIIFYAGDTYNYGSSPMSFSGSVNREHVWPNSRIPNGNGPDSDALMIRPTWSKDNSGRGNSVYSEKGDGGYYVEDARYRGDAARIIFYLAAHYGAGFTNSSGQSFNLVLNDSTANAGNNMGKLSTLLKWNLENPVNDWEYRRNDAAQGIQGNRNPFIDYPDLACNIWGDFNAATKTVCKNSQTPVDPVKAIGIEGADLTVAEGKSAQISYNVLPSNATDKAVTFSGFDSSIISVSSSGAVTGVKEGTTQVTITLTSDSTITKTITVTVTEGASVPEGDNSVVLDVASMGVGSTVAAGTATVNNAEIVYEGGRNLNGVLYIKSNGYIYNTTSLGSINSIVVKYLTEGSPSTNAAHYFGFSSSVMTTAPTTYEYTCTDSSVGREDLTVTPSAANQGFFRIDIGSKNLQVKSITINYSK